MFTVTRQYHRYSTHVRLLPLIGCMLLLQLCVALPMQLHVLSVTTPRSLPVRGDYSAGIVMASLARDTTTRPPSALVFADDPSKAWFSKDFYHDVRRLALGIYNFVQHPSSSFYDAITHSLPAASKKHKKAKQPANNSVVLDLDPFGNLSFTLGVAVNFQVSHNIGFSRMLADASAQPKTLQLQRVCPHKG